jgi:adenosine kinase
MTASPILISGSLAYDSIMVYQGKFRDQIMVDKLHLLNLVFFVPTMRREFGGCAGNIAYNLKALGGKPLVMAAVGKDFAPYQDHLTRLGINQDYLYHALDYFTAQAFITTDEDDNQITAFHPGAMQEAHHATMPVDHIPWGIVSPNGKEAMIAHLRSWSQLRIGTLFDPGQGLPLFSGDELRALIPLAKALIVNDYELQLLLDKTGYTLEKIAKEVGNGEGVLLTTLGAEGCELREDGKVIAIPAIKPKAIVDPTGCGDAFRGGLLCALGQGSDWVTAAKVGTVVAGIKIAYAGGQNHPLVRADVAALYHQAFAEKYPL